MSLLAKAKSHPKLGLVILAYVAFIALGMPDGLLGVAWPSIRAGFALPLDSVGYLLFASVSGYLISSLLNGALMARLGVGRMLAISCALTGVALIGYTLVPAWWMMVLLGVCAGLGAGAIDAGLNTYVASHFGEGLMQWLHASYGIGVTLGPIVMTVALSTWNSWRIGYRTVGAFQLLLAICFGLTLHLWQGHKVIGGEDAPKRLTDYKTPLLETLRRPRVWLSVLLFFVYCGAEGSLGTWTYSLLTESRGIRPAAAGFWAGSYWAMFTVGRTVAGLYVNRIGVNRLVQGSLVLALLGTGLLLWNPIPVANLIGVAVTGLAIAPIFAAMISGTSARVGAHHAANTIGFQMAAASLGIAGIPSLVGVLARQISLEVVPVCLAVIFAVLLGLYTFSTRPASAA